MAYKNLVLGVSPITNTVFAGRLNKKGNMWLDKVDVTGNFLSCCLQYFKPNTIKIISENGKPVYEITIKKIDEFEEKNDRMD